MSDATTHLDPTRQSDHVRLPWSFIRLAVLAFVAAHEAWHRDGRHGDSVKVLGQVRQRLGDRRIKGRSDTGDWQRWAGLRNLGIHSSVKRVSGITMINVSFELENWQIKKLTQWDPKDGQRCTTNHRTCNRSDPDDPALPVQNSAENRHT